MLASASGDKTIMLWDMSNGRNTATLTGHMDWVFSVAFSKDGMTLASGSEDKTVKLWDIPVAEKGK
jgi:WD40 repeat protein